MPMWLCPPRARAAAAKAPSAVAAPLCLQSRGLHGIARLPTVLRQGDAAPVLPFLQNGARWTAMRHGKRIARLGRPADQRKALVRNLTTEVLRHGKIRTTVVKAKALRRHVDRMITLAKNGSLHARRQALAFVYDKDLVGRMFEKAPNTYGDRSSGYCRVVRETKVRRGDAAEMATIELL